MDFSFLHHFISGAYAIKFADNFGIHWNGLAISLSIICSFVLLKWLVSRQRFELTQKQVFDFLFTAVIGVLVGARLGYCLFIDTELFFQFNHEAPYWGAIAINEGGFSSFGAILGGLFACGYFTFRTGISRLYLMDLAAVCAPIALFFSRAANIFTGEIFGKVVSASEPATIKVPQEILYWPFDNFDKLQALTPLAEKAGIDSQNWQMWTDQYSSSPEIQGFLHSALMQIVQYISTKPEEYFSLLEPLLQPRFPVSIVGSLLEGILLFFIVIFTWYKPRRPGIITAVFLVLYAALQIAIDPYRQQNTLETTTIFGMSEQMILSGICLVIGIVGFVIWNRSEILRAPGWGRGQNVKLHRR